MARAVRTSTTADAKTTARRGRTRTGPRLDSVFRGAAVVLVAAAVVVTVAGVVFHPDRPEPSGWTNVAVDSSGTLWEIASLHGVPGLSTSETVELIRDENGLASSTLYAGQTLRVPAVSVATAVIAQR